MTWEKSLKIVLGEFKVADGHREATTWGPKGIAQLVSISYRLRAELLEKGCEFLLQAPRVMVFVMTIVLNICEAPPGFPDLGKTKASWILLIAGASVLKWPEQYSCGSHLLLTRALLTVLQFIFFFFYSSGLLFCFIFPIFPIREA